MTFSQKALQAAVNAFNEAADDTSASEQLQAAISAALAVDGLALVPKEPTQEMIDAASAATSGCGCADRDYDDDIRDHWAAMLAAASEGEENP